ncbi:NTF2-like protein [Gymnopus androsaceus JB14]|uniref:NTF2-like protein n=1 Tax=Gymnopus androsaceus JB14 TaxID=1447944 RepID=A0A6A4HSD0_9AGAR|nr:NTF2-like protein [Gymnopus androsaceus JB14]
MGPLIYDPSSLNEQEVALPSAPLITLSSNACTGPGMIAFLPPSSAFKPNTQKTLDPEPVQKWAEEGFAVVSVTSGEGWSVKEALTKGIESLLALKELDTRDRFAIYVYDPEVLSSVISHIQQLQDSRLSCLVAIGSPETFPSIPAYTSTSLPHRPFPKAPTLHLTNSPNRRIFFFFPKPADYASGEATLAHSRVLVFLRKILGGPIFDIEAIWEEHLYFWIRSAKFVAEPYVNHVPTMTGGIGRKALTAFYRDHFIFANPGDTVMIPVSRTIGSDRVVDEFILKMTHDRVLECLLPGVPPTGKLLEIPMMGVISMRGDRLYHEHIWWDQATALLQAGILPSYGQKRLRLPVAGAESARLLMNEMDGKSNEMFGSDWGVQDA